MSSKIKISELKGIIKEIVTSIFKEMSVTGAASPVQVPHAFSKRNKPVEEEELLAEVSSKLHDREVKYIARELEKKGHEFQHYTFEQLASYFSKKLLKRTPINPQDIYIIHMKVFSGMNPDEVTLENISETVTGNVDGYNVPMAFSRKGGSNRAVQGSNSLGYELTPTGKKEMNRKGDNIY